MDVINVTKNRCKQCYSCVRNCPVKAVQIHNGQASIVHSRCISCGKCVKSCPQNAKVVVDDKVNALNILSSGKKVIACLAPSFVVSFYPYTYDKVIGALKEMGFDEVWEVGIGAEKLSEEIGTFLNDNTDKTYLSTTCPAFVAMIEKHYPELIPNLAPFVSPMIATAKIIKKKYEKDDIRIIFIGPCIAKKVEASEPQYKNLINSVLTFEEIKEIFIGNKIDLSKVKSSEFDMFSAKRGRLMPLTNGLLKNLNETDTCSNSEYISISEEKEYMEMLSYISKGKNTVKFADVLMCKGCVEGPKIDTDLNYYEKINIINNFYESTPVTAKEVDVHIDLTRSFTNKRIILPYPSEDDIRATLQITGKFSEEDELNCGACGYSTCRSKAIAVLQGIAEVEMCLPYLITQKNKLYDMLAQKYKEISSLKDQLEATIESSYDGIVVTDGNGRILISNTSWVNMLGLSKGNTDNHVEAIEEKGIIFPSATLLALKEKRRISFIQKSKSGNKYLATGTPIFDPSGDIKMVVTNIRDIDELYKLKKRIEETMLLEKYHNDNMNYGKNNNFNNDNIIANSLEFGAVLQTASNVANVDSTVLLLGESGVGKEVVGKFIHKFSSRASKPLITVNCGAIPENLIESELFGYETGAFTGAQKNGKPGLIELANEGTLFLDEVGELPLNLQVKLLRVLQEKKITRLGGVVEKAVDIRTIAATNRNLHQMVIEGKFRSDLYYRLNVIPIEIPPLRARKADIIPLCYHFINNFNKKYNCHKEITIEVEQILKNYNWPGNIRELENLIERLIVTTNTDTVDVNNLPKFIFEDIQSKNFNINIDEIIPIKEAQEMLEKQLIENAYKKCKSTYEMAKLLGINQSTIVRKLNKYSNGISLMHD